MRALCDHAPRLAQLIDQVDELDFVPLEPTRDGGLTCRLTGPQGEPVYLHSRYDPVREADRWAEGIEVQAQAQTNPQEDQPPMCFFVDGFGLGYHVAALFERLTGEAFIVVSEPNLALLRTALEHFDYSEMFASNRLIIMTAAERDEVFRKLEVHSHALMLGVVFTQPLARLEGDFHARVHRAVAEYAGYVRTTLITVLSNSVRTCRNVLQNLPTYVATDSIDVLRNRFAGCPAVVVSAGPSLHRNLDVLRRCRDRVVVVAVQTTLKPLLAAGIRPDFVTSLDYHEVSQGFFAGLEGLADIHLVAEPKAHWSVIDIYRSRGPLALLGNEFARLVLREWDDPHDNLRAGCTVAHLAFYLAQYLGADPIILVGQDLGFTHHVYYSPGTALHQLWQPELGRFCTLEMKEWERIVRSRAILRPVQDIHGRRIYTDEQMFTYLQQFERDFAACPARVIDATEGGVAKQFCQPLPLAEAIDRHAPGPVDPARFDYRRRLSRFDAARLRPARALVQRRLEEVEQLARIGRETLGLIREMLDLVDDQSALNQRMIRLDELRTMVRQRSSVYRLVCYVSQMAEMFRFRQDHAIRRRAAEGKERQRQQLRRDVRYVGEINAGCDRLAELLRECLTRFDEDMKTWNVAPAD